jgi:exodeoxyribonuclease V beta subunit
VLIEASAGTGKTHTLGRLYLRLVLEAELGVEQIIVATFSNAAAQELRQRLHDGLAAVEAWLTRKEALADTELADWLSARAADPPDRSRLVRRLQLARIDFDRAPITTIHALCQRIQRDFLWAETASFASAELLDEGALLRECLEDFWRQRYLVGPVDPAEAEVILAAGPEALLRDLKSLFAIQGKVLSCDALPTMQAAIERMRGPEFIAQLHRLVEDDSWCRPGTRKLRKRLDELAQALATGGDVAALLGGEAGAVFDPDQFESQLRPGIDLGQWPVLGELRTLRTLCAERRRFVRGAVLAAALEYCRTELPRRARARGGQTYGLQIDAVYQRLCGETAAGGRAADELFRAFPVALIDEFQDTDPRQYAIFDRIFRDASGAVRGLLVMIGDPKQAIYGFRGGDIATYLRARAQTEHCFALDTNYRASQALVAALNALYAHGDGGFADPQIRYQPVQAAGITDRQPYAIDGAPLPAALYLHTFREVDDQDEPLTAVDERETAALADCAARITELLNDRRRTIGGEPLAPRHIAVLVPQNRHAVALRRYLAEHGVPCSGGGRASVFATDTARELALILEAVRDPGDERAVRAALCTRLLGADLAALVRWQEDASAFETQRQRLVEWRALGETRGVLAIVRALLVERAAALLALPDGERVVTDLRHLGELLAEGDDGEPGLAATCARLASFRDADEEDAEPSEARRLRMDSDAERVQLLTIHAAKGLEFPIVFLPLAWREGGERDADVLRFHDADGTPCLDLGSVAFAEHAVDHRREQLQESLRLLYVALTRAQYAVHVYWSTSRSKSTKAGIPAGFAWLLDDIFRACRLEPSAKGLAGLVARLAHSEVVGPHAEPKPRYLPRSTDSAPRRVRSPLPAVRAPLWLHSYSSLARRTPSDPRAPAADEFDAAPDSPHPSAAAEDPRLRLLEVWRGRRFGNAVHRILELARPTSIWPTQRRLVETELARHAVRPNQDGQGSVEAVGRMLDRVCNAELDAGLRLRELEASARVAEFEFLFPVEGISLASLRAICTAHGAADLIPPAWTSMTLRGLVHGFADLVFRHAGRYHVLDYKTNRLGTRLSDYAEDALERVMRAHHYRVQALLYQLALHRHLRARLADYAPERHLGESWYVFVRAVGLAPKVGVWRYRWPTALLEALDAAFAETEEAA